MNRNYDKKDYFIKNTNQAELNQDHRKILQTKQLLFAFLNLDYQLQ